MANANKHVYEVRKQRNDQYKVVDVETGWYAVLRSERQRNLSLKQAKRRLEQLEARNKTIKTTKKA